MSIRAFVGLAFVLNLLLSNVCLIGSAYAATPGIGESAILLSREVPMSFNVVTCTWVKTDNGWQPTPDSPCASGHCLKKEKPDARCIFQAAALQIVIHFPVGFPVDNILALATAHDAPLTEPTDSPPPYPGLASTVMLM